jgi:thioredoxin 1
MHFPVRSTALSLAVFAIIVSCACLGQGVATAPTPNDKPFAPFEQWKELVLKGDADGLKTLYSAHPVAHIKAGTTDLDAGGEVRFWVGVKAKSMHVQILQGGSPQVQPGSQQILFQAEIRSAAGPKEQTYYISGGQLWQQQDQQWRILVVKRTDPSRLEQPTSNQKNIYPSGVDAHTEIKEALHRAEKAHKRVLVVFGANWCYDCHVLDLAFSRPDVAPILESNFEVVHVDTGQGDKNQDLMKEYEVPMDRGIPAVAVLDAAGKLLFSQKNGEFEKARALGPEDLLAFLDKWKPKT